FSIGLILFIYLLLLCWALTLFGDTVFDDLFSGFTYISCCCQIILGNLFGIPLGLNKPGLSFCSFLLLQVLTEYILVSVTSAVTVTIAGVVKEAVTILVAVFYFHDQFTWLKGVGLFTIMVGVSLFNWYKYLKLQTGHSNEVDMGDAAGDIAGSLKSNINARYVILEEVDEQEDST
ncbi:probable sugar phosphate/phosphate translocator At1g06470, partial [Vitis vinifera]|uniref:probable sugar phosphate/phosphate translocator At1g06470 n=1 Tax=Vitis vinifera TaxID=29760 RepID=UPI0028832C1E